MVEQEILEKIYTALNKLERKTIYDVVIYDSRIRIDFYYSGFCFYKDYETKRDKDFYSALFINSLTEKEYDQLSEDLMPVLSSLTEFFNIRASLSTLDKSLSFEEACSSLENKLREHGIHAEVEFKLSYNYLYELKFSEKLKIEYLFHRFDPTAMNGEALEQYLVLNDIKEINIDSLIDYLRYYAENLKAQGCKIINDRQVVTLNKKVGLV